VWGESLVIKLLLAQLDNLVFEILSLLKIAIPVTGIEYIPEGNNLEAISGTIEEKCVALRLRVRESSRL
jgi:hypothetical protein